MTRKKQYKVLHVISSLDIKFGGPTSYILELVRRQIDFGINSYILTTHQKTKNNNLSKSLKKRVFSFKCKNLKSINYSRQLKIFLDNNIFNFDLIHIHGMYRFPTTYAAFLSRKFSIPYIIRIHGVFNPILTSKPAQSFLIKKIWEFFFDFPNLKGASLIQCSSIKEKNIFKKLNLNNKIFVSYNFINKLFQNKKINSKYKKKSSVNIKYPFILFVGRINFVKGLDMLIPVFSKFSKINKKFKLLIIGPSNDDYLKKIILPLIKKFNISNKVLIKKPVDHFKLFNYYKAANIYVQPSYSESFGISMFEAMSCNLPVVTTDQIDLARELKKSNAAKICKCNENSLFEALEKVSNSTKLKKKLVYNATKFIKKNLDEKILINNMQYNYRKILKK